MTDSRIGRADTAVWHLPYHRDFLCRCAGPHLRIDKVLYDPDPKPAHRHAWPTRPLAPTDPVAAAYGDIAGEHHHCYSCVRRMPWRTWRTVSAAELAALPAGGCESCARPWPRSAWAAAAFLRSAGDDRASPAGLLCPPCAYTGRNGGWFEPSGRRRSPAGRAWYRLLPAGHPHLAHGLPCAQCGRIPDASRPRAPHGDAVLFRRPTETVLASLARFASPTAPTGRAIPSGRRRYPAMAGASDLTPPWPYRCHPVDLRDAYAGSERATRLLCACDRLPRHDRAWHRIVTQPGPGELGPIFAAWIAALAVSVEFAAWRAGGGVTGPYACTACALAGRVPAAVPVGLAELLRDPAPPPACGVACFACSNPLIPERWHRARRPGARHDPLTCLDLSCHACSGCQAPHVGHDEVRRPPGWLFGTRGARATRPLAAQESIGGMVERDGNALLLCPPCFNRSRRAARSTRPLLAGERGHLPAGCERCYRPFPLSALARAALNP